ncbi:MAG: hypothetical protein H0U44_06530 [Flavisolibacter sp.]|jgi:hypothetical protein|nr:hypothetical protein [Flavisolibacter sp.]
MNNKTEVKKDFKEKSVLVSREFEAPVADVWRAFTESELLDQCGRHLHGGLKPNT